MRFAGSQRVGDVCIRGKAKPKSSVVVLHMTSGLKMLAWSPHTVNADACTEKVFTVRCCLMYDFVTIQCLNWAFSHQFIQGEAQAAMFIQDKEASLPFLTLKDRKQNHCSIILVKIKLPNTEVENVCGLKWCLIMSYPRPLHRVVKICPLRCQTQPASINGFCLLVSRESAKGC